VLNRSNIPSLIESSISYEYNIKSFFSNRNTFAAFLLVGIYLTVYRLVFIRKNLLDILIGIFVVMNLILTLSRTSIAGMLIFLLVLSVFRKRGRKFIGLVSITPFLSSAQNLIFTIIVFMIPQYYSNSIV
jgi:hypothetical protein